MVWNQVILTPRFYEIDSYNIANNMYYLGWFEIGRFSIAKAAGLIDDRIVKELIAFVVVESHVKYIKPAMFTDTLVVESMIAESTASKLLFHHRIRRKLDLTLLAEGGLRLSP